MKNSFYLVLLIMLLVSITPSALYSVEPLLFEDQTEIYNLYNHIEYLEDTDSVLEISEISSQDFSNKFELLDSKTPNFGYKSSSYWLRFTISDNSNLSYPWVLEVSYPPLDELDLYVQQSDGEFIEFKTGEKFTFNSREMHYRNFAFLLPLKKKTPTTFYLRVKSDSVLMVPLRIVSYPSFIKVINQDQLWIGIYFGGILVIILYNLFLFISVQDKRYLWYITFISAWWISHFVWHGLAFQYFWPNSPGWSNTAMPFFYAVTSFFTLRFTQEFLDTKKYSKFLNSKITFLTIAAGILVILTLFLNYRLAIQLTDIMAVIAASVFVFSAFICWRKGFKLGVYYFSAFLILAIGIALNILASFAIIPTNFITRHGVEVGFILGIILLSLGLGGSINILKAEKVQAEILALATKKLIHYFPKSLVDKIISSPEALLPTSARKEVTVFFTDLKGFTDLTNSHEPEHVKELLNEYFAEMSIIMEASGATLDKFLGDGLMGYFGALDDLSNEEQAEMVIKMALEMQLRLLELKQKWQKEGLKQDIQMRIGIHQDFVNIGNFGSSELMSYTAIGNAVNLASRLEHTCTPGKIQVSHKIYELTKEKFIFEEPHEKTLKGFSKPHKVVEIDPQKY